MQEAEPWPKACAARVDAETQPRVQRPKSAFETETRFVGIEQPAARHVVGLRGFIAENAEATSHNLAALTQLTPSSAERARREHRLAITEQKQWGSIPGRRASWQDRI